VVTAAVAEVTATRITVYNMDRRVAAYRAKGDELEWQKGDSPSGKKGGVNLDEADYQLEKLGWITTGHWRWIEAGQLRDTRPFGYYKSVVLPVGHPRLKFSELDVRAGKSPEEIADLNMRTFGNPEGSRESRARVDQVKATGHVHGWEKRLAPGRNEHDRT
jgi:hypothetical protein